MLESFPWRRRVFLFKKIVSHLISPVPLCLDMLTAGLVLLWLTGRQKAGKMLVSTGTIVLLLLSSSAISGWLVRPLESRYSPLRVSSRNRSDGLEIQVRYIVVLSGGFAPDPGLPAASRLGSDTLARLVEGVRLFKGLQDCKLIMSGGVPRGIVPVAETMAEAAESLGVGRQDILLEPKSRDTEGEAQFIRPLVGRSPFILVTEASHMPRAMAIFRKQGMNPIAGPTDYLVKRFGSRYATNLLPNGEGLTAAQRAVYEYLALSWDWVNGKI
jgi:uncharacterized SAM-binding protein YcdF (DUF218 family)